jgi:very-short-patch-repair endonuclease
MSKGNVRWSTSDVEKGLKRIRDNQEYEQKRRKPAKKKETPDLFAVLLATKSGLTVVQEHRFHSTRKWRFDYCLPDKMIAIEQEGGAHTRGRHTRGEGFIKDMEKYNTAATLGWIVLRFTPEQMLKAKTMDMIEAVIRLRS